MNPNRIDRIARLFANRRLSRRQALATGGAALAATGLVTAGRSAAAQNATPEASLGTATGEKVTYLFVQSFQSGSIAPTESAEGRYTVTFTQGLGQTIYFGDRPSREVGTAPTPQFLEGLGFSEDNPPNAALLVETENGETDVAVVELFNPTYHPTTRGVTYDVAVLENWEDTVELGFSEAPADLAALAPAFGTAHLLIDDCPSNYQVSCLLGGGQRVDTFGGVDSCWNYAVCIPCEPYGHDQPDRCATQDFWTAKCNGAYANCRGECVSSFPWVFANC